MHDFSYQLYSSRKFGPLAATFDMLAQIGYRRVEGYGALFADHGAAREMKNALSHAGLAMPTAHFGLEMIENDPAAAIEMAKIIDVETVYLPYLLPDDRPADAAGWSAFGARIEAATAPLRDAGIGTGWHNHDFEFMPLDDGSLPITHMLDACPNITLELDLAWVEKAGLNPAIWIDKLGTRITSVHLKDIAPEGECLDEDGWADAGQGIMDWAAIKTALAKIDVTHFIAEHDNPSDDARFARRSLAHLKSLWGA